MDTCLVTVLVVMVKVLEHDLHGICIFNANDVILAEMKLFYILG